MKNWNFLSGIWLLFVVMWQMGFRAEAAGESVIKVNPVYEGVLSEAEIRQEAEKILENSIRAYNANYEFANEEEAAAYVREKMVLRENVISFYMAAENYEASFQNIVRLAYETTGESAPYEGDYLRYHYGGYRGDAVWQEDLSMYEMTYTMVYYTTYEEEMQVTERVAAVLDELNLDGRSEYEKIRVIYQYVCEHVAYDNREETVNEDGSKDYGRYTAYQALVEGTAVCQGYASLLYRMFEESGLCGRVITGKADGEQHAWNIIQLEGIFYNLDASWDAGYESGNYRYFLQNMEDFVWHERDGEFADSTFLEAYPMAAKAYHNWEIGTVIEATCTKEGQEQLICTDCGISDVQELEKKAHSWAKKTEEATCTGNGRTYQKCSVCQAVTDEKVLEKLEHTPGEWVLKKASTCTEAGYRVRSCTMCGGNEEREELPLREHFWKTESREATIFSTGYIKKTCTACQMEELTKIAKLPSRVELNTGNVKMQVGTATRAVKVAFLMAGDSVQEWTSSNKKAAVVNRRTGKIRARAVGKTYIKVTTKSGAEAKIRLTVQKKAVKTKKITFAEASVVLKKGKSITLQVQRVPVTANDKLTFTSSKPKVVRVTSKGVVKGLKKGTATVTVRTSSGKKAKCRVRVKG